MQTKYNEDFCGSLPLNFINQIQPYGALLALDHDTLNIIQASQNTGDMLGVGYEALVKKNIAYLITPRQVEMLKERLNHVRTGKLPLALTFIVDGDERDFLTLIHSKEDYIILEIERSSEASSSSFVSIYQELKYSMAAIQTADTKEEVYKIALQELRKLSGFDRIMIYQFDEHWNGTVVAEVLGEGMDPYLGLRFPASDVPKQARELYLRNAFRLIPNREYIPVKLYPVINPASQSFIDLSDCNIRSIAGVHLEYLKNMNVMASMSTRIVIDGKLWGLISCHHKEAKYLNYEMCSVFELLSEVISSKISAIAKEENFNYHSTLQGIRSALVEKLYAEENIFSALLDGEKNVLDLLRAEGAVLTIDRTTRTIGRTPDTQQIAELILWLQTNNITKTFATDSIHQLYEYGNQYNEVASGMIVLPIFPERGEYLIGFRPEVVQQVNWGGNPNEAVTFEEDGKTYHPRNSFKHWQQTLKNTSLPWHSEEIAVSEGFRDLIVEMIMKKQISNRSYN